jgi:hypothetical protein
MTADYYLLLATFEATSLAATLSRPAVLYGPGKIRLTLNTVIIWLVQGKQKLKDNVESGSDWAPFLGPGNFLCVALEDAVGIKLLASYRGVVLLICDGPPAV